MGRRRRDASESQQVWSLMEGESHGWGWSDRREPHFTKETSGINYPQETLVNPPGQLIFMHQVSCTWGSISSKPSLPWILDSKALFSFALFQWHVFCSSYPTHPKISPEKDGDLKTQVEKLWREVNALKEMQALQTGKTPSRWCLVSKERQKEIVIYQQFELHLEYTSSSRWCLFWKRHWQTKDVPKRKDPKAEETIFWRNQPNFPLPSTYGWQRNKNRHFNDIF